MVDVIVVEADRTESAFACIAIALRRPGTKVAEVRSVNEAKARLQAGPPTLVILGRAALHNGLDAFLEAMPRCSTVVGLAANPNKTMVDRALRAGVKKVYAKPTEWKAYVDTIENMLRDWLAIPAGVARGGEAERCLSC